MKLTGLYESEESGSEYINRVDMYFFFQSMKWCSRQIGLETGSFRILIFKKYKL